VTSDLECPVNVAALTRYVTRAGAEADVVQLDKRGMPRGTLREIAQRFFVHLGGKAVIRLRYRHSLLGAELVAAGFVTASREYAYGGMDPFRLPRVIRDVAFTQRGHDMDDSASYPRACLDVFRAGAAESREFLAHRETILAGIGMYYFGSNTPAEKRRKWAKDLLNALDNDGSVRGWKQRNGIAPHVTPPILEWGEYTFDLSAYRVSREEMTQEFEDRLPGMTEFVGDWLRARRDPRARRPGITAKSYFLMEAEALSRREPDPFVRYTCPCKR
jgi:hypothetical protein